MANTELAEKIYEFIKANPERHNQAEWAVEADSECGTQACVAGWAAIIGLNLPLMERVIPTYFSDCSCCPDEPGYTEYYYDEPEESWSSAAERELGISGQLAGWLFRGTGDRRRTVEAVRMLADGAEESDIIKHLKGDAALMPCTLGCCEGLDED